MEHLKHYFDYLAAFEKAETRSVDRCHNIFLVGSVLSKKPRSILELGIGTGSLTVSMIYALRYNGVGELTCVDDWSAWGGQEPAGVDEIRDGGVKMVAPICVSDYLRQCRDAAFDMVVADAIHLSSKDVLDQLERVCTDNAFMFVRNSNRSVMLNENGGIEGWLKARGNLLYHFTESTRADEHCEDGWLFSIFDKDSARDSFQDVAGQTSISETNLADTAATEESESEETLYLGLVTGENYGWGVCSQYLIKELSQYINCRVLNSTDGSDRNPSLDGKLFQAITGIDFLPMFNKARGRQNIGYTFFENELKPTSVENAKQYDLVLGGSSWCRHHMLEKGISNCDVLIQGIDPDFHYPIEESGSRDHFVIFSGGKFELRKGQDLVLKAVKILQEKYDDIRLVNCWYNIWPESMHLMAYSKHIRFEYQQLDWQDLMRKVYQDNGMNADFIQTCDLIPKEMQRELYRQTDLGVFPNRCEGGTNLVLMEYMACGKPVVASNTSGHKDVVNSRNALLLNDLSPYNIVDSENTLFARWHEPSLDELVAQIEYAYHHRKEIAKIGAKGGEDMRQFTWRNTAEDLLRKLYSLPG